LFLQPAPPTLSPAPLPQAGEGKDGFRLRFAQPQWAVTPGQSAVLYDGEICLGGGVIAAQTQA
jgi:tRNA-specific 2-thiouridylase